jgi:hypothetical protein
MAPDLGAAIQSAYGRRSEPAVAVRERRRGRWPDRSSRRDDDEHAIRFTEACLLLHGAIPDQLFLLAAEDAIDRLG